MFSVNGQSSILFYQCLEIIQQKLRRVYSCGYNDIWLTCAAEVKNTIESEFSRTLSGMIFIAYPGQRNLIENP